MVGYRCFHSRLSACRAVRTWTARTLVHINVTVPSQCVRIDWLARTARIGRRTTVRACQRACQRTWEQTLGCVTAPRLASVVVGISPGVVVRTDVSGRLHDGALSSELANEVVLAHTVGEARHTCALIRVEGYVRFNSGLCARCAVSARLACALVDVDVAVAA